jgi:hypothetical protein
MKTTQSTESANTQIGDRVVAFGFDVQLKWHGKRSNRRHDPEQSLNFFVLFLCRGWIETTQLQFTQIVAD